MAQTRISDEDLAGLIHDVGVAASAILRGDMRTYLTYIRHADDYTLMAPNGGVSRHGFDDSLERIEAMEQYFQGGEAELDVEQTYTSGNLAVLVVIERQHGQVGGFPDQDLSLRVTLVFRRDASGWWLVHRHADPLVREISLVQLAQLTRGEAPDDSMNAQSPA